jgi:hypothetical protein
MLYTASKELTSDGEYLIITPGEGEPSVDGNIKISDIDSITTVIPPSPGDGGLPAPYCGVIGINRTVSGLPYTNYITTPAFGWDPAENPVTPLTSVDGVPMISDPLDYQNSWERLVNAIQLVTGKTLDA